MRPDYSDQTDIFDPDNFGWDIHLIGLGGIGSALLFPLLKLGVHTVHLYDDDVVEPRNIPAQLIYRPSDIGLAKVTAAQAFAERQEFEGTIVTHNRQVTPVDRFDGIVISGVDSMESRTHIWRAIQAQPGLVPLYMDGRIGGEQLELLTLDPSDPDAVASYEKHSLFPDSEAAELPCAARTVIHPPTVLAGLMVAQLTLLAREEAPEGSIIAHLKSMKFIPVRRSVSS